MRNMFASSVCGVRICEWAGSRWSGPAAIGGHALAVDGGDVEPGDAGERRQQVLAIGRAVDCLGQRGDDSSPRRG